MADHPSPSNVLIEYSEDTNSGGVAALIERIKAVLPAASVEVARPALATKTGWYRHLSVWLNSQPRFVGSPLYALMVTELVDWVKALDDQPASASDEPSLISIYDAGGTPVSELLIAGAHAAPIEQPVGHSLPRRPPEVAS